jgi:transposase
MGNLFTVRVGNILTVPLGNVLTERVGKVLDICRWSFPAVVHGPISAKEVLQAYKFQPRLEKRFAQFKSIHRASPLLFKKINRVEANMFLFFIL